MSAPVPTFEFERVLSARVQGGVAGIDEVGRGPWAGPVVAAAVVIKDQAEFSSLFSDVRDSKALTPRHREDLFGRLCGSEIIRFALGRASVQEIDELNIRQATFLAMRRALDALGSVAGFLVDGNALPTQNLPGYAVIKGDQKCWSIAAASILAKVTRDREMSRLSREFPGYGWEQNAGYGTKHHQKALNEYGITPHHRRSFAPVRRIIVSGNFTTKSRSRE